MNRWVLLLSALAASTVLAQTGLPETPVSSPTVQSAPMIHVVQPGDSLIKIGRIYGVRVDDLRKANNLTGDLIVVGRKLVIPTLIRPVIPSPPPAMVELTAENQQLRQQLNDVRAQLAAAAAKALELQPALTRAETRLVAAEAQFKAVSGKNDALQRQVTDSEERAAALAATQADQAEQSRQIEQQLVVLRAKLAEANERTSGQATLVTQLTAEKQQLRQQLSDVSDQLAAAAAKAAELQPALTRAETLLAATEAQFKALADENAAIGRQLADAEKRADALIASQANDLEKMRQLEQQLAAWQEKLAEADRQLAGRSVAELDGRMAKLNEEMLTLRARLNVYETRAIPYTAEELALFRVPAVTRVVNQDSLARAEISSATAVMEARAEQNLAAGEFAQAEERLVEVVQEDEKAIRAFCNLAITQAAQERYVEAEQTIRKALALSPDDGASLAVYGHALCAQKRFDEAFDALSRAAASKPDDAGIQALLGVTLAEKGMRGQAESAFRKALHLDPSQIDAHRNLAIIYATQESPPLELARWHYRKSIAAGAPASPDLEKWLAVSARKNPSPPERNPP